MLATNRSNSSFSQQKGPKIGSRSDPNPNTIYLFYYLMCERMQRLVFILIIITRRFPPPNRFSSSSSKRPRPACLPSRIPLPPVTRSFCPVVRCRSNHHRIPDESFRREKFISNLEFYYLKFVRNINNAL